MHVFKSNIIHGHGNKKSVSFMKGEECPKELHAEMEKKGLIEPLPEPVRPVAKKIEEKK